MRSSFTRLAQRRDMVTEPNADGVATDMLCVECGWTGRTMGDAPFVAFMLHTCRLRTESASTNDA